MPAHGPRGAAGWKPAAPRTRTARGFSIAEVIVVMIILGVLGALVVPRLINTGDRQAEIEAQAVRSFLSQAAQKDAVSSETLAVAYNAEKRELSVQTLQAATPEAERTWQRLRLIRPLRLTGVRLTQVLVDGQPQVADTTTSKESDWRIEFSPARPRPIVTMLIQPEATSTRAWQVDLLPGHTSASIRSAKEGQITTPETKAEDLDLQGRRADPW